MKTKTITKKVTTSAKRRELIKGVEEFNKEIDKEVNYQKGFRDGVDYYREMEEATQDSIDQYHKFNKYGSQKEHNWCMYVLIAIILGIVSSILFTNFNYGSINV